MKCANCEHNGGVVYLSLPPTYRCTITDEFHLGHDACNVEFAPVKHGRWIPVTERLPERDKAVLITWANHKPMSYYADIKDVPFTAVAVWHGIWYWWSVVCEDLLLEYGRNEADEIDKDVEVIAWMPMPEPYRGVKE